MRYQIILDQRPQFQDLVTDLITDLKSYKLTEHNSDKAIRITKVRLFASAVRAAYDADTDELAEFSDSFEPLNEIKEDRQNRLGDHHFVFIYARAMDYVKGGLANLAIENDVRFNEREYIHFALYYYQTLNKTTRMAYVRTSEELHPMKHRPRRPNGWREKEAAAAKKAKAS